MSPGYSPARRNGPREDTGMRQPRHLVEMAAKKKAVRRAEEDPVE
ncbi:hypothetical protein ACFWPU_19725 [Streptomyces sp. NPDC058471]